MHTTIQHRIGIQEVYGWTALYSSFGLVYTTAYLCTGERPVIKDASGPARRAGKTGSGASLSPQRGLASMPGKPDVSPVTLPSPPADARLHCAACVQSSSSTPHWRGAERFVQPADRTAEDIRFWVRMRRCAPQLSGSPCRADTHRSGPRMAPPVRLHWAGARRQGTLGRMQHPGRHLPGMSVMFPFQWCM